MPDGIFNIGGVTGRGGLNIKNSNLKSYKVGAGYDIDSSSFVQFINSGEFQTGIDVNVEPRSGTAGYFMPMATCRLSDTKVFVIYGYNVDALSSYLCATIITTDSDGKVISIGNKLLLHNLIYSQFSICKLTEDRVLFVGTRTSIGMKSILFTINGTTITNEPEMTLSISGGQPQIKTISNNKAVLISSSGTYIYSYILTISESTITKSTVKTVISKANLLANSSYWNRKWIDFDILSQDKFFVCYMAGTTDNYNVYGIACTISGDIITIGSEIQLSTAVTGNGFVSTCRVSEDKFFACWGYGTASSRIGYSIIGTLNGLNITLGAIKALGTTTSDKGYQGQAICVNPQQVIVLNIAQWSGSGENVQQLVLLVATISGTTITYRNPDVRPVPQMYSGQYSSGVALNETNILILHSRTSSWYLDAIGLTNERLLRPSVSDIHGVSKNKGSGGSYIDIFTL